MTDTAVQDAERVVRAIAQTAIDNERWFCDLDAVVGDGDFGYSLARGFEKLMDDWDGLAYDDPGGLLKKTALVLSGRIGGTSGPLWGTAFLRAGVTLSGRPAPTGDDTIAALRAAIEGVKQRGESDLGDKTLLDALVPAVDRLEEELHAGTPTAEALQAATETARAAADATKPMLAQRGRAAYTGERSRGSVDPGAVAVSVMFEAVTRAWSPTNV